MEYRILGRTGVRVSPLCLGTDNFADPTPEAEASKILEAAIDAGINLIDTGDVYADGEGEKIGTTNKILTTAKGPATIREVVTVEVPKIGYRTALQLPENAFQLPLLIPNRRSWPVLQERAIVI